MYGMIHRAVRQMVIDRMGDAAWAELERGHGIAPTELISASIYADEVTVGIIVAAAQQMGTDVSDALRQFGNYWVTFAERGSYGALMEFVGKDLPGFIANLDRMHQAVQVAMPGARVPSFELVENGPDGLLVRYSSDRSGLDPFVIGLLEGLVLRFGHTGRVNLERRSNDASLFRVRLDSQTEA